ncbi:hypothetical protein [Rhizobium sp. AG855]|uniref:hypothetical protein n=1 Tax=Rhizobium sp. AG855 TaxID=2183898 RepID=UPI0011C49787|nr:hypothetical protein [Rhizobium sp. AG855]
MSAVADPITTSERSRGFRDAHEAFGVSVDERHLLACGYAPDKAAGALRNLEAWGKDLPHGLFVDSTIYLEGVMRWMTETGHYGERRQVTAASTVNLSSPFSATTLRWYGRMSQPC